MWLRQQSWNDNLSVAIVNYFKCFEKELDLGAAKAHCFFPDKLADFNQVKDFGQAMNLECTAIYAQKDQILTLSAPFIGLTKGYRAVVVTKLTETEVEYIDGATGTNKEDLESFAHYFTGHGFTLDLSNYTTNHASAETKTEETSKKAWKSPELIEFSISEIREKFNDIK